MLRISQNKSTLFLKLDNVELRWVDPCAVCAVLVCKTELVFLHELGAIFEAIGLEVRRGKDRKKEL
jgi:hypothetical protein